LRVHVVGQRRIAFYREGWIAVYGRGRIGFRGRRCALDCVAGVGLKFRI